jgi:hypothetical protein
MTTVTLSRYITFFVHDYSPYLVLVMGGSCWSTNWFANDWYEQYVPPVPQHHNQPGQNTMKDAGHIIKSQSWLRHLQRNGGKTRGQEAQEAIEGMQALLVNLNTNYKKHSIALSTLTTDLDYLVANNISRGVNSSTENPMIASHMTDIAMQQERCDELKIEIGVNLERLQCMRRQPRDDAADKVYNKWLLNSGHKQDRLIRQREKQVICTAHIHRSCIDNMALTERRKLC